MISMAYTVVPARITIHEIVFRNPQYLFLLKKGKKIIKYGNRININAKSPVNIIIQKKPVSIK